jgi:hypothetical protein
MKSRNPLHVEFGNRETIIAFSHDRGALKSNAFGDYFFRGTTDNRFCCCSEDLERKLIDMGIRAGERVSIKKVTRDRIATWEVRRLDAPAETQPVPTARKTWPHNGHVQDKPIPVDKYAPPVSFPECEPALEPPVTLTPTPEATPAGAAQSDGSSSDSLLTRALCEAIDAAKAGQAHAAAIGFPLTFSSSDIQDLASTIFIQRCRDGAIVDRIPPARQTSGKVNGLTQTH